MDKISDLPILIRTKKGLTDGYIVFHYLLRKLPTFNNQKEKRSRSYFFFGLVAGGGGGGGGSVFWNRKSPTLDGSCHLVGETGDFLIVTEKTKIV